LYYKILKKTLFGFGVTLIIHQVYYRKVLSGVFKSLNSAHQIWPLTRAPLKMMMQSMIARSTAKTRTRRNWSILIYAFLIQLPYSLQKCYTPPGFGSFDGSPARSLSDCIWDFTQCSNINAADPDKDCCQKRFDECCENMTTTWTPEPWTTTTWKPPPPPPHDCPQHCPRFANTLIGCVWQFNTCVQKSYSWKCPENSCYHCFDECCKYMMGTTNTMMENSVDEIPVPFMSVEQTTKSSMTSSNSMTVMNIRKSPTLAQCIWAFFKCDNQDCDRSWNQCMDEAMKTRNP